MDVNKIGLKSVTNMLHHHSHTIEKHRCKIMQIVEAMRKDLSMLDVKSMAVLSGMSAFHFLRVFQETTGVTPIRFLTALRMQEAKRLLIETDLHVTTICFEVGYSSLGTFTRIFKDFVGLSPGSFRKLGETLANRSIEFLISDFVQRPLPKQANQIISGTVLGPNDFHGIVFIGMFDTNIPRRRPIQGTILLHYGRFELELGLEENRPRCLMAVGFKNQTNAIQLLLCTQEDLLVASTPISNLGLSNARGMHELTLRPCDLLDPPILSGLPIFLKNEFLE